MRIGKKMMIAGGVLVGVGAALVASAGGTIHYNYSSNNGSTTEEGNLGGAIGALGIAGGIGLFIPGVIINSKGKKRYNDYLKTGASASFKISATSIGVTLVF